MRACGGSGRAAARGWRARDAASAPGRLAGNKIDGESGRGRLPSPSPCVSLGILGQGRGFASISLGEGTCLLRLVLVCPLSSALFSLLVAVVSSFALFFTLFRDLRAVAQPQFMSVYL